MLVRRPAAAGEASAPTRRISSRGSFSYVVGLLSDGIVICEPFYPPQRNQLICDDDGGIDADVFTRRCADGCASGEQ